MSDDSSHSHPANSLPELLLLNDRTFVRVAYLTVLGRQAEPAGEAYYLLELRSGIAKVDILRQLRRSTEGQRHQSSLEGLDPYIRRSWLDRLPFIRIFGRRFSILDSKSYLARFSRTIVSELRTAQAEHLEEIRANAGLVNRLPETSAQWATGFRPTGDVNAASLSEMPTLTAPDLRNLPPHARDVYRRLTQRSPRSNRSWSKPPS